MDPYDFEELMRSQNMMLRSVANESETDSKIKILGIINSLVTDRRKKVHKEALIIQAEQEGMTMNEIDRIITSLISDRVIEEHDGFITIS
jgi:hypothetical protein